MITGLDFETARGMAQKLRCAECGAGLLAPHLGNGEFGIRCSQDPSHEGTAAPRHTRVLSDGREYDIQTQKPVDQYEREGTMIQRYDPEAGQVMHAPPAISSTPMTIEEFDQRMGLIEHVVKQMKPQVHFGVIPGTRDRSLWEPGAEYLRAAFNIAWSYEVTEQVEDYHGWNFRYTIRVFQLLGPGIEGPSWIASASNRERKFWCNSDCPRPCDQDHEPSMEREMHPHNVRDRALKRAFVGMIRNVTGTTGYFREVADSDSGQERPAAQVKRQCAEHKKTFQRREKDGRVWYSHREGNGYCNAPTNLVDQWERPDAGETSGQGAGQADNGQEPEPTAERNPSPEGQAPETETQGLQGDSPYAAVIEKAREHGLDEAELLVQVINQPSWAEFEKLGGTADVAAKRLANWAKQHREAAAS